MSGESDHERVVVVHRARTWTEAMVIRGLLESAGIGSPATTSADPYPLRQAPKGFTGNDIQVLESEAPDAREIIADYLASSSAALEEDEAE